MMTITRARALKIAMDCIAQELDRARKDMILATDSLYRDDRYKARKIARYKELADAFGYIERLSRQRELL